MGRDVWDRSQWKSPHGDQGREVLEDMNEHHRPLSQWALSKLPEIDCRESLDVGCGGGMLISLLADKYPQALLRGIDISTESVKVTEMTDAALIAAGRCTVRQASAVALPYADCSFDLVTAFETYFFWPDIASGMSEATRVLRPGGVLAVVSETYPHPAFAERNAQYIREYRMNIVENSEMVRILEKCGLNVTVTEDESRNWVLFTALKTNGVDGKRL
jgi:ubiquinone/menaquinone biosynthesis C-methylase UbiE